MAEGITGTLKFSAYQLDGVKEPFVESDFIIDYELTPGETLTKGVNEPAIVVLVKSKDIKIAFTCRLSPEKLATLEAESEAPRFMTTISLKDVPDDKEFRQELVARPLALDLDSEPSTAKIVIHFKVCLIRVLYVVSYVYPLVFTCWIKDYSYPTTTATTTTTTMAIQ